MPRPGKVLHHQLLLSGSQSLHYDLLLNVSYIATTLCYITEGIFGDALGTGN